MPVFTYLPRSGLPTKEVTYATEEETLAFANKIRAAGGGDIIKSLIPSRPSNGSSCILARAFNFDCYVDFIRSRNQWVIYLYGEGNDFLAYQIAESIGTRARYKVEEEAWEIDLPKMIGAVAEVFDNLKSQVLEPQSLGLPWPAKYQERLQAYGG